MSTVSLFNYLSKFVDNVCKKYLLLTLPLDSQYIVATGVEFEPTLCLTKIRGHDGDLWSHMTV